MVKNEEDRIFLVDTNRLHSEMMQLKEYFDKKELMKSEVLLIAEEFIQFLRYRIIASSILQVIEEKKEVKK